MHTAELVLTFLQKVQAAKVDSKFTEQPTMAWQRVVDLVRERCATNREKLVSATHAWLVAQIVDMSQIANRCNIQQHLPSGDQRLIAPRKLLT